MTEATRRDVLATGLAGLGAGLAVFLSLRPAQATPESMTEAIRAFAGSAKRQEGGISLDLPPLVENGNVVPLTVSVDSPMSADSFVKRIAIFAEKNPQPHVGTYHLSARSGRASVSSRIRLADSQAITAIAEMSDGSFREIRAEVIVTLAACVEG